MAKKQTAGRDNLGKLAPKFAELNDDVLFGEVWSREEELSARDRSMITIAALFSAGMYPQLKAHLSIGKDHGVRRTCLLDQFLCVGRFRIIGEGDTLFLKRFFARGEFFRGNAQGFHDDNVHKVPPI